MMSGHPVAKVVTAVEESSKFETVFSPSINSQIITLNAAATNQKDGSSDWQTQRYRKAMQRSRDVKQHRKSVQPTAQTPLSQISGASSSWFTLTDSKENPFSHRAIIDTSFHKDLKNSKESEPSIPSSVSIQVSNDMRRVLSTISTNSPPRMKEKTRSTPSGDTMNVKRSPKKASSSSNQNHTYNPHSTPLPHEHPHTKETVELSDSKDIHRHYHSLAKTIQDKMKLHDSSALLDKKEIQPSIKDSHKETIKNDNSSIIPWHDNDDHLLEYSQFVMELKREVSQDHTELWKSFQTLFGRSDETKQSTLNTCTPSSTEKYRLTTSSQSKLRDIHDFLNSNYPQGFCLRDTQLVNDKRLKKEQQKKKLQPLVLLPQGAGTYFPDSPIKLVHSQKSLSTSIPPFNTEPLLNAEIHVYHDNLQGEAVEHDSTSTHIVTHSAEDQTNVDSCDSSLALHNLEAVPLERRSCKLPRPAKKISKHLIDSVNSSSSKISIDSVSSILMSPTDKHEDKSNMLQSNLADRSNNTNIIPQITKMKASMINVRPPLPPSNPSFKTDRVLKDGGKRLSWLSSLREKQKKYGKRLHLSDDESLKDDETASVTTNDLEQYSIQKVGIENVIAIFGTRASPSRRPSIDETYPKKSTPSPHSMQEGTLPNRPNSNFLSTPKSWLTKETLSRKIFPTPFQESPIHSRTHEDESLVKQEIIPHPLCVGDVIDLLNLPKRIFQSDESIVKLSLAMKDDRRQFVVLGRDTILTACSFSSLGSSSKTSVKDSANVLWCSYRSQVKSITLSNDATNAVISLVDDSSCLLPFSSVLDCMVFMKAFYTVSDIETPNQSFRSVDESYEDDEKDGKLRGSPKPKRDEASDVTTSSNAILNDSQIDGSDTASAVEAHSTIRIDGIPLSDEEMKLLENFRKSQKITSYDPDNNDLNKKIDTTNIAIQPLKQEQSPLKALDDMTKPSIINSNTCSTTLSEQDKMIADKYIKMLKFSIPMDAVSHKMKMDQTADHIVSFVLAFTENAVIDTDESAFSGQLKQMEKPICEIQLSSEDSISIETYRKMLKVGLPPDVVHHRMVKDKASPVVMEHVLGPDRKPTIIPNENELSPDQEKAATTYRNMLKMGVPKEGVRHKMKMDQVDERIVAVVLNEKKQTFPNKDVPSAKKSNLKPIYWTPIPEDELSTNNVWGFITKKRKRSTMSIVPESQDMSRLEDLFGKKENHRTSSILKEGHHPSETKTMVKIIDNARAQNVAISLKAFREFSFDELIHLISCLDEPGKIQGERIQFMKDFLPTTTEEKAIAEFKGSDSQLQPVELFFRKLSSVPRAATKITIIQTMANFNQQCQDVLNRFDLLYNTCNQIMGSEKLQLILEAILTIGNIMNQGTHSGDAIGFKFESLLKLTDTKSVDGSMTVLDYIVTTFIEKRQRVVLDLITDFPDCHVASRIAITDVVSDVASLGKSLKECRTELLKMKHETSAKESVPDPMKIIQSDVDPRRALLTSILSRNKSKEDSPSHIEESICTTYKDKLTNNAEKSTNALAEDLSKADDSYRGLSKLEEFVRISSAKMEAVELKRNQTIKACKDLALYCGESGGERAATTIVTILSEFVSSLQASIVKYDQRKEKETQIKKREVSEKSVESVKEKSKNKKNMNIRDVLSPRQALLKDIVSAGQKKISPKATSNHQTNRRRTSNNKATPLTDQSDKLPEVLSTKVIKTDARQDLLRGIVEKAVVKKGLRRESAL